MDEEVPPGRGTKRMFKLAKRFNAGALSEAWATVEDSDELDNFRAHRIHAPHDPFPVAMVCRRPHGVPGHHDISNPQNAAWLAGCRYAKRKVFIQTPTFNARPLVRAVKHACRRGVEVILFLDLGFNDMAESIMFQGGTNEQVVDRLYKKLIKEGKSQFLKVYWYTSKDQIRPLNAIIKQRNCHIKFAAYDDEVMIMGNANGDTQSVFHSGEVNIMIDNKQVVAEVMDTLLSNQNTLQYGGVQADGVWRDGENKTLADYGATGGGGFIQGFKAFVRFAKTAAK
jgi:phosphatidylserine/phosphatidylglycerophosphate/cardiolipin synthase-like enzyme